MRQTRLKCPICNDNLFFDYTKNIYIKYYDFGCLNEHKTLSKTSRLSALVYRIIKENKTKFYYYTNDKIRANYYNQIISIYDHVSILDHKSNEPKYQVNNITIKKYKDFVFYTNKIQKLLSFI